MFRLTTSGALPASGSSLLKSADYERLVEANAVIEEAHKEASAIREDARRVYEEMKSKGYRDGQEEGKQEHIEKIMDTVLSSVEFIEGIEGTLVNIVNQAIKKIIGDLDEHERIVRIVRTALNNVRGQQKVTVRVSLQDEPIVNEALASMSSGGNSSFLNIVGDARLERDSCILESELGVVDASLSTQLKAFENAFNKKITS